MKSRNILNITGVILLLFGVVTLVVSSAVLFDWGEMREKKGNYVHFVVLANFFCSILYLIAAYGMFVQRRWSFTALEISAILLMLTFIGMSIHVYLDNKYEEETVYALIFRILVTLMFLFVASRYLPKKSRKE